MNDEDTDEPMEFEDLNKALQADTTDEKHRKRMEQLMKHRPLKEIYEELKSRLGKGPKWGDHEFWFCNSLIELMDYSRGSTVRALQHRLKFLEQEMHPDENPRASAVLGGEPVVPVRCLGDHKLSLLGMCEGVRLYEIDAGWKWTFGTLVGNGDATHGGSPICEKYLKQMDPFLVRNALLGQDLIVKKEDLAWAERLCESMDLRGDPAVNPAAWRTSVSRLMQGKLTASYIGVVMRAAVQVRAGKLGCFARLLQCCALRAFRRQQPEILPMPLPSMSEDEKKVDTMIQQWIRKGDAPSEQGLKDLHEAAKSMGAGAWTWLQVLVINAMFCCGSGDRMLHEVMIHSAELNEAQREVLKRQAKMTEKWLMNDEADLELTTWHLTSERMGLGDMYTGVNIGKSYPLTLEAIKVTTPGKGQSGKIELADVVDPSLKKFVAEPELLRIPDEELVDPRMFASVQVAGQDEWERIVSHLVDAGMLEREVEGETLTYKGEPVRNGMFGVHKGWVMRDDGTWLRTLRLIVNLIPSNSFQRRVPYRTSEQMGYAPLWGQLYVHDSEVVLCCAEDQKQCFHLYRPGSKWRGYFVLSRKAAGWCFKDGRKLAAYPRVRSAPMGWSNIVDFIQSGFEAVAKAAGLEPSQVIRMNQPSPLQPLTSPRSYYSFYVDNFDELLVVWKTDRGKYEGRPSDSQLKLRQEMDQRGITRDPRKASEASVTWNSLGAEVDGELGWVGSAGKFRRGLLAANLDTILENGVLLNSRDYEAVVSKNMHSVQYQRPLASLFDTIYQEYNREEQKWVSEASIDELIMLTCSLPTHWIDQRCEISGQVLATDASEDGAGACITTGITKWGRARINTLAHELQAIEGDGADATVVIEAFAGIGGFSQALRLLGFHPMGVVGIDALPECGRIFRQHVRHAIWYDDIHKVQGSELREIRRRFP